MDKLTLQTPNKVDKNIKAIAELFPNTLTERITGYNQDGSPIIENAIDFDMLKQELSNVVVEGAEERYTFNWADKKKSILLANAPNNKTLRPCRGESVNFDTTENLYIEGDNVDVLKLLQETYLGKIKMIYIDPPYNTGKDFIYADNFAQSIEEYNELNENIDEDGNRLFQNTETNGRYHTDWLNMIYPRLRLAKDLLKDDGVIFISIDDNEVHNLRKVCDEVFGAWNFVSQLIWQKKTGASDAKAIATITEYILIYSKSSNTTKTFTRNKESFDLARYKYTDEFVNERGSYYIDNLDRGGLSYSDSLNYGIECPDGTITFPNGRASYENDGWIWKWSKQKIEWARQNKFIEFRKSTSKKSGWSVCYKNYLNVDNENKPIDRAAPHKNLITNILNANASAVMKSLFNTNNYFDYSKPLELMKALISLVVIDNDDIVLDFFSGSSTTAHAVMQLNSEDGGNRKFIMVQLPELIGEKEEAYKAGYRTICDIGKERIRRAGKKINEKIEEDNKQIKIGETPKPLVDIGFRVLKVDSTNMEDVFYKPENITQIELGKCIDNVKKDRSPEDLLFQVMLDLGILLSSKIHVENISGKNVFVVYQGELPYLIACFDNKINADVVTNIAKRKPYYAVFKDSSIESDSLMTNFEQIFETYSKDTNRRVL